MRLLSFNLFEKAQPEWFEKHPNFYLSKAQKELRNSKNKPIENKSEREYINQLKKLSIDDIKISYSDENKEYSVTTPNFLLSNSFREMNDGYSFYDKVHTMYNYKIVVAFIKSANKETLEISHLSKDMINPIFKELSDYYGLFYGRWGFKLFLTKDRELYKNKITELRSNDFSKIFYYNNKTKGKEFTDIEEVEINKIKNQLKNIKMEDIYFEPAKNPDGTDNKNYYRVRFRDKSLTRDVFKYKLLSYDFFQRERSESKVYFGHLKNRYHTMGMSSVLHGIGLGYKIYKAFLKFNGYMVSDEQTSLNARKMYLNLMKDDDVYFIIDKKVNRKGIYASDSAKVMLIWKDYPKIEQLVRIVRTHELRKNRKYEYDKALLPYIENITKETV